MTGAAKYKMGHVNLTTPIKVHFVISLLVLDTFIQNMTSPCAGNSELRSPLTNPSINVKWCSEPVVLQSYSDYNLNVKQVRPSSGTDVYPRMPILRPHAAQFHEGDWRVSSDADASDFGLLGEQRSPKWEILCPWRPWTTVQNLTPLALSSPEKSVTVQHAHTHRQTVIDIFTLRISACVDNNILNLFCYRDKNKATATTMKRVVTNATKEAVSSLLTESVA